MSELYSLGLVGRSNELLLLAILARGDLKNAGSSGPPFRPRTSSDFWGPVEERGDEFAVLSSSCQYKVINATTGHTSDTVKLEPALNEVGQALAINFL